MSPLYLKGTREDAGPSIILRRGDRMRRRDFITITAVTIAGPIAAQPSTTLG